MTAKDIQRKLIHERYNRGIICPNYTPKGWFECDVMHVTDAGYFNEYEIKLSRQDFAADRLKRDVSVEYTDHGWKRNAGPTKHQRLAMGDPAGPRRFYFVVPQGMLKLSEIPEWAGLLEAVPNGSGRLNRVVFSEAKGAPVLKGAKVSQSVRQHLMATFYWRFYKQYLTGRRVDLDEPVGGAL